MSERPDWMEILREAHQEPIGEAHYAAVRARVLAEIARRERRGRWFGRWWMWAAPAVAVAAVLLATVRLPRPELPALPRVAVRIPAAPAGDRSLTAAARTVAPRKAPPVKREPLLIKLATDDPNIVIYWIAD